MPIVDIELQNRWLYPFDAEADTIQRWQEVSAEVMKELQDGRITPRFANVSSTYKLEAH
jgi:salicylate hydroxylase